MSGLDEKSKKQLMALAALVPVLLFLLGKNFIGPMFKGAPARTAVRQQSQPQQAQVPVNSKKQPPVVSAPKDFAERVRKLDAMEWGRNPFQTDQPAPAPVVKQGPRRAPAPRQKGVEAPPIFKLEGIFFDDNGAYAIINGELRGVGDRIFFYEVIEIKRDRVTLMKDDQVVDLRLFPDMR